MKYLIDSHILVWLLFEPERFNSEVKQVLSEADAVYVSPVSLWELSLKYSAGKLRYSPQELADGVEALNLALMPLEPRHAVYAGQENLTVKDTFDRILIAQAAMENCVFVTADKTIKTEGYPVLFVTI